MNDARCNSTGNAERRGGAGLKGLPASRFPSSPLSLPIAVAAGLLSTLAASPVTAQEPPTVRSILTGYGAIGYSADLESDETRNDFSGFISIVPLARIHDDVLVEGELEFELEETETNVVLEHVEVHYLGFERVQIKAGKFHLPIGVWSHTNWTNKMPTPPLLYEDTHGDAASEALMPIPFDLGAMATWTPATLAGWRTSVSFWASQGPAGTFGGGHTHDDEEEEVEVATPEGDAALLALGGNYFDNNEKKMGGLSFRAVSAGGLTLQVSGFRAAYDDAGDLYVHGGNLGFVWTPLSGGEPMFELKGEGTILDQEFEDDGRIENVTLEGYYLQASKRYGAWEPVARWSHLPRSVAGETILIRKRRQLALGLNYWLSPSVPVKAAYQYEADGSDEFLIEWAVGF